MQEIKKTGSSFVGNNIKPSLLKAFTLTEVLIATFISTLVLSFIFLFLSNLINDISNTKNEVSTLSSFHDFNNKLNNYRNLYTTGGLIIDTSTGSDVFLMRDVNGENGILLGAVKFSDNKISTNSYIYEYKTIGFRKVSTSELALIDSDVNNIYNMSFQEDNMFFDLNIQDLNLVSYNSGAIYDLNLVADLNFQSGLIGEMRANLSKESLIKFNIDF